jgi:hypothetical protein
LRPEAVETLFYLWRATGDEIYREWGWNMFRGFERWCRLKSGGYATLNNVNSVSDEACCVALLPGGCLAAQLSGVMKSLFIAITLRLPYMLSHSK